MIMDKQHDMSDAQAFTAAEEAISTNLIDLGALGLDDHGAGGSEGLEIVSQVSTAMTSDGSATIEWEVQMDTVAAFSSPTVIFNSGAIAVATCVAGYRPVHVRLPGNCQRFIRCTYTVAVAVLTAGAVDTFLTINADSPNIAGG